MPLAPGTRLGPYELTGSLGAGGMGEVFRARDTRLGREVAIKVIGDDAASDPDRRQRFQREARAIAALSHPHICTIHDVGSEAGVDYLVLELLHGESLASRLRRGPLPLDEALTRGIEIAQALDRAHRAGIIHRDLKPGNVMLSPTGAKVLDFGLARITRGDTDTPIAPAETTTASLTEAGVVLGTMPYMAPEQIEGRVADARTDVFSFGATFYEMLAGKRPFEAATGAGLIAAIVRGETPTLLAVQPNLPAAIDRVVRTCLAKNPEDRFASLHDVVMALQWARDDARTVRATSTGGGTATATRHSWVRVSLVGLAAAALGAVGTILWFSATSPREATAAAAGEVGVTVTTVTTEEGLELFPSLAPDGKWVVYTKDEHGTGQTDILLRAVGGRTVINLTADSSAADLQPAFEPDGERIVFRSERDGGGLFVMGRTGESVSRLTSEGFNPSWSPDGLSIVYGMESISTNPGARQGDSTLWIVSTTTGQRHQLTTSGDAVQPSWSPHGRRIAYWAMSGDHNQRDIWTVGADGGQPLRVTDDAALDWSPAWSPDGQYLYFSSNRSGLYGLWRVAIDESSGQRKGEPEIVPLPRGGVAHFSFSRDGRALAMASLTLQSNLEAAVFDLEKQEIGTRRRLTNNSEASMTGAEGIAGPAVSPDGRWLAFSQFTVAGQQDLWVVRTNGTGLRQLTNDPFRDNGPSWFPNSDRLMFRSDRTGRFQVWTIAADGGSLTQVTDHPGSISLIELAPDARRAVAAVSNTSTVIIFDPRVSAALQKADQLPSFEGDRFLPSSWSSDGTRIAGFLQRGRQIALYSFTSRAYEQFAEGAGGAAWLPDNRSLVHTTGRELRLLDTKTRVGKTVLSLPTEVIGRPAVSPNGREIYTTISKQQGDIIIANIARGPS